MLPLCSIIFKLLATNDTVLKHTKVNSSVEDSVHSVAFINLTAQQGLSWKIRITMLIPNHFTIN